MSLDRVARVFEERSFRERYDVLDRIDSGSFAQVYRAVQRSTGQDVAVKILTLDDRPDADPIQLQIARSGARCSSAPICAIRTSCV
jgi:predicted unusual protein kinase regulating ubiquinone biosynthesis (AarF/ABC1/UbiB family)